ncbi:hypothetical protein AJ80_07984 [Polytolypa hystricis UAMH7299]|uniref:Uncharacterized protein n=1 Tax=Polytolypa hystricis (strain UAMH7299) TaxID=1447883 RepID=A0A2B7XF70_POLH7|nr:hypothetical protein AJ80_07984 [Polytolypa hystricis UAMH7299]
MTLDHETHLRSCARIHNALLRESLHISPFRSGKIKHFFFSQPQRSHNNQHAITSDQVHWFLAQLDLFAPHVSPGDVSPQVIMAPHVFQPSIRTFMKYMDRIYQEDVKEYIGVILLYENAGSRPGGLFFDILDGLAYWHDSSMPLPPKIRWMPLLLILSEWYKALVAGKLYWEPKVKAFRICPYVKQDLYDSLEMWKSLIDEIEKRLPHADETDSVEEESSSSIQSFDKAQLDDYQISSFAKDFLLSAAQPRRFKYIAPGITILSPAMCEELYGTESVKSSPLRRAGYPNPNCPHAYPTLLFPAQPLEDCPLNRNFDDEGGLSQITVRRYGGLCVGVERNSADAVTFIDANGRGSAFQFSPRACPWSTKRLTRLVEVLRRWRDLVRNGNWSVGANGVAEGFEWVHMHRRQTMLTWAFDTHRIDEPVEIGFSLN